MKAELAESIREKRVSIDELLEQSKRMVHSDCTLDARKSLRRSLSWLGKCLQALKTENPYPQSMNTKSKVIEKRADTTESVNDMEHLTPVALVKHFRSEVEELAQWVKAFRQGNPKFLPQLLFALDQVEISLIDCKMDFGWELNRISNLDKTDQELMTSKTIEELSKTKKGNKWLTENMG